MTIQLLIEFHQLLQDWQGNEGGGNFSSIYQYQPPIITYQGLVGDVQLFLQVPHCLWHTGRNQDHRDLLLKLLENINGKFRKFPVLVQKGAIDIGKDDPIAHSNCLMKAEITGTSSGCRGRAGSL